MKQHPLFGLFTLFLLSCTALAQTSTTTFESYKLLESRTIRTYVPENYDEEKMYPLFVVLDAEYLFDNVVANAKFYSYWNEMPEAIVVGIEQKETRNEDCGYDNNTGFPDQRGNQFFEFLGMEVIPNLAEKYNLAPFKIIVGHDFSANFINYFLFKDRPKFSAYINISPDLSPEMENRLPERLSNMNDKLFYFLATNKSNKKQDRLRINSLQSQLKNLNKENLTVYTQQFEQASNNAVAAYAIPQAMDKIFQIFKPISKKEYKEKILTQEAPVYHYLEEKYQTIEDLFNMKMSAGLNDIMAIYAAALKKEDLESLKYLGNLGKKQYPETMLGFFITAEFYEKNGQPKKALKSYEKAFSLEEIDFITKDLALERMDALKEDFGW